MYLLLFIDGELSHPKWSLFEKNCNTVAFTNKPPHLRSKVYTIYIFFCIFIHSCIRHFNN